MKTMAQVQPMAPKKGYAMVSIAVGSMLMCLGPCWRFERRRSAGDGED